MKLFDNNKHRNEFKASTSVDPDNLHSGIIGEFATFVIKIIAGLILVLVGGYLIYLGITDNGSLSFTFGSTEINCSYTYIGLVPIILGAAIILTAKYKVNIKE